MSTKYDTPFKLKLVSEYLAGPLGSKAIARKYGIPATTVKRWVSAYVHHGAKALEPKITRYSAAFKLKVLQCMWDQELSYQKVAALFDIRSPGHIGKWARLYASGGLTALDSVRPGPKTMHQDQDPQDPPGEALPDVALTREEQLLRLNLELRVEVAYLKKLDALMRTKHSATPKKRK